MKILYVGSLDPFGTSYSRMCSLRELEADLLTFDVDPVLAWGNVPIAQRYLERRLLWGPRLRAANRALVATCRELRPDLVWVDKGDWLWSSSLRALRGLGCYLVHHITDALHPRSGRVAARRRLLRSTVADYDLFFTTNVEDYGELSGVRPPLAQLTDLGYDHRRFEPSPLPEALRERWEDSIVFVGHYEPETEAGVLALVEAGLPVTVYGHAPWFRSPNRSRLGDRLRGLLGNEEYVYALKGSRVGLCFVSVLNYNQTASRSFEIPGCGTFLLATRSPQHLECYREGEEAEFFGDHEELVRKARYYLEHPAEREAMARRGCERTLASGYSWDALMRRDWARVLEHHQAWVDEGRVD